MNKTVILIVFSTILSLIGYYYLANEVLRTDHSKLFSIYAVLVVLFAVFVWGRRKIKWQWFLVIGIGFRILFVPETPRLSDDFYRFVWDGKLQLKGESAFESKPIDLPGFKSQEVVSQFPNGMNSASYYSIYPYTLQPLFLLSVLGENDLGLSTIYLKVSMLLFEIMSFLLLLKILAAEELDRSLVVLYWLNPMVIIELCGNLHFEGVAIFFLLLTIFYLRKNQVSKGGIALVLAIGAKLTPVFLLGASFRNFKPRNIAKFYAIVISLTVGFFVLSVGLGNLRNFWESFTLYFEKFEFNAPIYSSLHWLVEQSTNTDIADKVRPLLSLLFLIGAAFISLKKTEHSVALKLLWIYCLYFLTAQVVHPWYLTLLIPLAIITQRLYPIVWAILAFFSYNAYHEHDIFSENLTLNLLVVVMVIFLIYTEEYKKVNLFKRIFI